MVQGIPVTSNQECALTDNHIEKAKKSLRDRDELRSFLQILITVAFPIIIAITSALISFSSDETVKEMSLTLLIVVAVLTVIFGVFLHRISTKEFYSVVFDFDDLKMENNQLENMALNALKDSLLYKAIADTLDNSQMELTPYIPNRVPISFSNLATLLENVLAPIESMVAELFMLDKNTYYSFSVYLLGTDEQLHSVYRKRNFNEESPSRVWPTDADGSHIVSTFNRKKTSASSNIWKTDILISNIKTKNPNVSDRMVEDLLLKLQ